MIDTLVQYMGTTYLDGSAAFPGWVYHPIPYEEYLHIPAHKTNCIEELKLLLDNYNFHNKTILEVGAAVGWFTFQLSPLAEHITAYEADPTAFRIMEHLVHEKKIKNITLINEHFNSPPEYADCIIMLNVAMWLDKQLGREKLKNLMKSLKCDVLFYQTAHTESNGMYKMEYLKDQTDIENYLKECNFTPKLIKTTIHDNKPRHLFKASRNIGNL